MLLIDLIKRVNIDDVIKYLSRSEPEYSDAYRKFYNNLLKREVKVTGELRILVALLKDYLEDDSDYVHVCGYNDKDGQTYSLLFIDWSKCLGFEVVPKSLDVFGDVIFVAECFKEMTAAGFEESDIEDEKSELDSRIESIENGTAELISSDEFFARLSKECGVEYNPEDYKLSDDEKQKIKDSIAYNEKVIKALVS